VTPGLQFYSTQASYLIEALDEYKNSKKWAPVVLFLGATLCIFFNLKNMIPTHTQDFIEKNGPHSLDFRMSFNKFIKFLQQGSQNIKGFLNFLLSYLFYSQIW
jgi:hypothetical protein